jgi:hypothetical protein
MLLSMQDKGMFLFYIYFCIKEKGDTVFKGTVSRDFLLLVFF